MRVMDRNEFLAMPEQTVYASGPKWALGPWFVKLDNCTANDWFYDDLTWSAIGNSGTGDMMEKMDAALEAGKSFPVDFEQTAREGAFDQGDLYAVLEPEDIRKMIERLQRCL